MATGYADNRLTAHLGAVTSWLAVIWIAVTIYGEFMNGAPNSACYPFLGCDSGFFGYDALEHFLFGVTAVWAIIWLWRRFPRISLGHARFWKSALTILSLVMLVAVLWEMGECFRDAYLLDIAHQSLVNFRLHINYLAQPSNFDTMGDLTFTMLGALISITSLRARPHLHEA
jgi:hypothetical protein